MGRKKNNKHEEEEDEGDGEGFISLELDGHAKRSIAAIFLVLLSLIFSLGFFNAAGTLGDKLINLVGLVFGWGKYLAPFFLAFVALVLVRKRRTMTFYVAKIIGLMTIFVSILTLLHLLPFTTEDMAQAARDGIGGGFVGYAIAVGIASFAGKIAGTLIVLAVIFVGAIIAFNMSLVGIGDHVPTIKKPKLSMQLPLFGRRKKEDDDDEYEDDDEEYEDEEEGDGEEEAENNGDFDDDLDDADFDDDDTQGGGEEESDDEYEEESDDEVDEVDDEEEVAAPKKSKRAPRKTVKPQEPQEWRLPDLKPLKRSSGKAKGGDVKQSAEIIEETLSHFGIDVEVEQTTTGPTVTQYAFTPPSGVKLSKIVALNADLALALAAHPIRIEAPIPGKALVGIEVPNKETAMVRLRDLLDSDAFEEGESRLKLALGENVNGDYLITDLAKAPHMLVAGATGAGKSVAINSILLSLLYQNSPDDLKMILVDPKRVELSLYNGIPHLLCDVIVDNGKVLNALKWAVGEMERRYKLLQETGSRDLGSYNQKRDEGGVRTIVDEDTGDKVEEEMENLPVIVIVIDELADLMSSHGKEVEGAIVRIAQMARAIGIHLIVSTQRPSVEVITGLIKANLPTRVALRVATQIDSRTILDSPGAEKLVGHGDMLFSGPSSASAMRVQGVYVEEMEVKKVVDYIKKQNFDVDTDIGEDITGGGGLDENLGGVEGDGGGSDDALYEEAKNTVIETGKASTSYLQRRLRIGYSRAARLIDLLEENGIVGPANGSKPRDVLLGKDAAQGPQYDDAVGDQQERDQWQA